MYVQYVHVSRNGDWIQPICSFLHLIDVVVCEHRHKMHRNRSLGKFSFQRPTMPLDLVAGGLESLIVREMK